MVSLILSNTSSYMKKAIFLPWVLPFVSRSVNLLQQAVPAPSTTLLTLPSLSVKDTAVLMKHHQHYWGGMPAVMAKIISNFYLVMEKNYHGKTSLVTSPASSRILGES